MILHQGNNTEQVNLISRALIHAGISFERPNDSGFYLPDYDTFFIVQAFTKEDSYTQLGSPAKIIYVQDTQAVDLLCQLIANQKHRSQMSTDLQITEDLQ